MCGGESGIRTHGRFHVAGFQDRFLQPLGHLSILECRHPNTFDMIPYHLSFCQQESWFSLPENFEIFFKKSLLFGKTRAIITKLTSREVGVSGCSAVGSALDWGSRGREFKSRHSDQTMIIRTTLSKWVVCSDLSFLSKMCFDETRVGASFLLLFSAFNCNIIIFIS